MTQTTALHFYLLGSMRIERDSVPIHLPRRKVESLLAYLLLHPEQHGRDQLATLFWGDSSDAQARHSLRTALENVQNVVGTHGVYNLTPTNHNGVDERARVPVLVRSGAWRLLK